VILPPLVFPGIGIKIGAGQDIAKSAKPVDPLFCPFASNEDKPAVSFCHQVAFLQYSKIHFCTFSQMFNNKLTSIAL